MKRILIFCTAFILTACGGLAPAATSTAAPTTTPVIVVQTVLVTVIPTQPPTATPTLTPLPSPTATAEAATSSTPTSPAQPTATAAAVTATLPANAGGDLFTNLTRSGDHFALRCQPGSITFGVSTSNPYVVEVDLYYRIQDRLSVSISNWHNGGKMQSDKNGNFTLDFSAAAVDPDLRSHKAWLDYQFVGINKLGDAVGRSLRIVQQITYTIDCSD
jgi:hypothetical protein